MSVAFADLSRTFRLHQDEYEDALLAAARSGWYVLGDQVSSFEKEFADYVGAGQCIGVGNGTAALILSIRALEIGEGDEVIVAGNTYIATVLGITENGAKPVFVDCNEYYEIDESKIEAAITSATKAVLVTNLYGQCCNLAAIRDICDRHGLYMVEDCAQCHGATIDGLMSGTVGDVSCFSFYPTKPLGALGDGGAVVTSNEGVAERVRMLRNYGSRQKYVNEVAGINSRLDEIQAAVLRIGLRHLDGMNDERIRIADRYLKEISNPYVELPRIQEEALHVFHIFAIRSPRRDELQKFLAGREIGTQVHYPIPPHRAQCFAGEDFTQVALPMTDRMAQEELSLPIYCGMPEEDVDAVIAAVNCFPEGE